MAVFNIFAQIYHSIQNTVLVVRTFPDDSAILIFHKDAAKAPQALKEHLDKIACWAKR